MSRAAIFESAPRMITASMVDLQEGMQTLAAAMNPQKPPSELDRAIGDPTVLIHEVVRLAEERAVDSFGA